jgi:hypothetical protein
MATDAPSENNAAVRGAPVVFLVCGLAIFQARTDTGAVDALQLRPDRTITLRGIPLIIHLAAGDAHQTGPLLLYATGDGGFPGDEALFSRMMPWGYPLAAISSADYIAPLMADGRVADPRDVAADFSSIINAALDALSLPPETGVVLVGFSRGAGLAVAATLDGRLGPHLVGVLAVGLGDREEYVAERVAGEAEGRMFLPYAELSRLGTARVAVIQSTQDNFLPAAEAQRRFGPDQPTRRFRAIEATNHSFGGSLPQLVEEMRASLSWILR